ncbi:MAG: hypothetical protein IPJ23_11105 [Ignavibacteriales bacterium]|nr:hypothetical protein [Ignavibacteriales bacterium]
MKNLLMLIPIIYAFTFQSLAQQKILVPYSSESIIELELASKITSSEVFEQLKEKKIFKAIKS